MTGLTYITPVHIAVISTNVAGDGRKLVGMMWRFKNVNTITPQALRGAVPVQGWEDSQEMPRVRRMVSPLQTA